MDAWDEQGRGITYRTIRQCGEAAHASTVSAVDVSVSLEIRDDAVDRVLTRFGLSSFSKVCVWSAVGQRNMYQCLTSVARPAACPPRQLPDSG